MRAAIQILLLSARLALTPEIAAATLPMPDYSGVWKLNRDLSDDPAQALRDSRGSSSSGRSGGHHGHGRGGGGGGRSGGGDAPATEGSEPPSAFAALDSLTIRQHDADIDIQDGAGRDHTLTIDGKKTEEERSYGGTTKIGATWRDAHLEIVSVPEHGPKWTETYSITADRTQLTITTKIEGSHGSPATFRRVYDAVPPAPPTPQEETPQQPGDSVSVR